MKKEVNKHLQELLHYLIYDIQMTVCPMYIKQEITGWKTERIGGVKFYFELKEKALFSVYLFVCLESDAEHEIHVPFLDSRPLHDIKTFIDLLKAD